MGVFESDFAAPIRRSIHDAHPVPDPMNFMNMAPPVRPLSFARALLYAGIVVSVLDIADALIFYGLRGVAPHLIFQSIASGLLGRAAFSGGLGVEILGGCLHFFIAFTVALVYLLASGRIRTLAERPWVWGPLYGLAVWFVMYFIVLPHSGAKPGAMTWPVVTDEIGIHLLGVGLPVALVARKLRMG